MAVLCLYSLSLSLQQRGKEAEKFNGSMMYEFRHSSKCVAYVGYHGLPWSHASATVTGKIFFLYMKAFVWIKYDTKCTLIYHWNNFINSKRETYGWYHPWMWQCAKLQLMTVKPFCKCTIQCLSIKLRNGCVRLPIKKERILIWMNEYELTSLFNNYIQLELFYILQY